MSRLSRLRVVEVPRSNLQQVCYAASCLGVSCTSGLGQADPASADTRTAIRYFLNKPFDAATLLRTVRAALDE